MTWWMRPGPRRFCARRNASPSPPSVFATGTRTPVKRTSQWVFQPRPACPITGTGRTTSTPGGVGGDEDHRPAPVRLGIRVRDREDDGEAGSVGAAREPLVPVDHPVVAVPHGTRLEQRRVGAGDVGLGHREERPHLAGDERAQEALLLLVRAEQVQDLRVPGIGRLAAEHELRVRRAPDLLVEAGVVEEAEPGPSRLGRHVRRPEARLARAFSRSSARSASASLSSRSIAASFG